MIDLGPPKEEKANFGITFICAKKVMNETIKTRRMTESKFDSIMKKIAEKIPCVIELENKTKMEQHIQVHDVFVVTSSLLDELDYVEAGVYEGIASL